MTHNQTTKVEADNKSSEIVAKMLQQDTPDDYVIATGSSHSVRELCQFAFEHVGLDYRDYVEHDVRFERPAEVDQLLGDATKAQENLGWNPSVRFQDLIVMMVESDLKLAAKQGECEPSHKRSGHVKGAHDHTTTEASLDGETEAVESWKDYDSIKR